jgi:hypothetical protein
MTQIPIDASSMMQLQRILHQMKPLAQKMVKYMMNMMMRMVKCKNLIMKN